MSCNSSFPVGRSGSTRVAPPERQLEIRVRMRACRETLGISHYGRFGYRDGRAALPKRHRTALVVKLTFSSQYSYCILFL